MKRGYRLITHQKKNSYIKHGARLKKIKRNYGGRGDDDDDRDDRSA